MSGKCTSFDAEVQACYLGVKAAMEVIHPSDHTIVIASDNIGNLRRAMKPSGVGSGQLHGVWISEYLKEMNRKVVFLWSPSHVGIQWNEYVDKLASDINKSDEPLPDYKSFAFRGQEIRQK